MANFLDNPTQNRLNNRHEMKSNSTRKLQKKVHPQSQKFTNNRKRSQTQARYLTFSLQY